MNELKDIRIGVEDEDRIEWVEFDTSVSDFLEIDSLLLEKKLFWDKLEIICVKECCGFDAYSFYPETIRKAKDNELNFEFYLSELMDTVINAEQSVIMSTYMNQLVHKRTFLALLQHIREINE